MISEILYGFWHFFDQFTIVQVLRAWIQDDNIIFYYLKCALVGGVTSGLFVGAFFLILNLCCKISLKNEQKEAKDNYNSLLKQYYRQYGDYVFEIAEIVEEIKFICKSKFQ